MRIVLLCVVMSVVAVATSGCAILLLYNAALNEVRERLVETARGQASLIDAIARFDQQHTQYSEGAWAATLAQIRDAYATFRSRPFESGDDLELLVAQKTGDRITLLLTDINGKRGLPPHLPWDSELAAPLRRALTGESGTMEAADPRGVRVLAAYEPAVFLGIGIVAQIPLADVRRPFTTAIAATAGVAIIIIGIGMLVLLTLSEPILRRVRESEAIYRGLYEQSPSPQFIIDPATTHTLSVNQPLARLLEYSREELARLSIGDYDVKEAPEETRARIANILDRGSDEFETVWKTKHGNVISVLINVRALDLSGRMFLHCVATDLTERVRAERRIRELRDQLSRVTRANELGEAVSSIAHELKQPLTAALNYVNAMRHLLHDPTVPAGSRRQQLASKAAAQIERANDVIGAVRSYIRHDTPERTPADLNGIVREAVDVVGGSLLASDADILTEAAPGLPAVLIDRVQVQQVIVNLLHNALEATARQPARRIWISTERVGPNQIDIVVRDNGPGIPEEFADRLFQPFFTTKARGLGIGLSISRGIAEAHGGQLIAETGTGGATFRLRLPVGIDESPAGDDPIPDKARRRA